ncbi:MAG: DUF6273 domain-containing protein [Clostridia bacterium]
MPDFTGYPFPSKSLLLSIDGHLGEIAAGVHRQNFTEKDWAYVADATRRGLHRDALPIRTRMTETHGVYGAMPMNVIGHDHDLDPSGASPYSITMESHKLLESTQFDAQEAFYYAAEELPAGTHNFIVPTTYDKWAAGTYQFTLTQAVPAGGQLCVSGYASTALTALSVKSFASRTSTTAIETVTIAAGSTGTCLGTFGEALNHAHRVSYGSGNWKESAIRQWLNSEAAANAWWNPQTNFDRPPQYLNRPGFMVGLSDGLKAVIGVTEHKTIRNTVNEAGGSDTTRDKIFLLSQKEIWGTAEAAADDGTQYPFYVGMTNEDRIKYNLSNGSANYRWVRSPNPWNTNNVRLVGPSGAVDNSSACYAYGVAAAWTIY